MTWVDFHSSASKTGGSIETEIRTLWREYLIDILGIPPQDAQKRIEAEVAGQFHDGLLNGLESRGWLFSGSVVLDLGCGTGALANELAARGANVIGLEPSPVWAITAGRRLRARGASHGVVIMADGASIPLADQSVQYVISLQVLEHIPMPAAKQVISEIARVLQPGGRAYLSFENYWSFWEPHYRVRWFPLLPKPFGSLYLRLLGRDSRFLRDHIYYNSFIGLAQASHQVGLTKSYWTTLIRKLENPELVQGQIQKRIAHMLRILPADIRNTLAFTWAERSQLMQTTVRLELMND